ncbi:xanthine dehydrogenase family protein molybdopterin-binding subunit [Nocardioides terrisoli]|uniref:xanthine dehydrogenase family protein molybdopterin-binding subunit n=1 Tax=Nocardioides terrisoli TaxID=3388267 RepID=UPI00287BC292|nr:molybdopterin cofactor-binding domain-containing protein [Nocardioides marmorisolisilvae]
MTGTGVVGRRFSRPDALAKASGRVDYLSDTRVPGMLEAAVVRSPFPRARVISVDTSEALAVPGVVAVVRAEDLGLVHPVRPFPESPQVQGVLTDSPMFVGDAVAAVVAQTRRAAQDAAALVFVDYEELRPILDPEESLRAEDQLFPQASGNLAGPRSDFERGDFDGALARASRVFVHEFETQRQCASTIEPMGCICTWHADGRIDVVTHLDNIFHMREQLAEVLGVDESTVVVTPPEALGATFGLKNSLIPSLEPLCALLSRHTGHPVRLLLTPEESMTTTVTRHPARIKLTTGVAEDGALLARGAEVLLDSGAYGFGYIVINSMAGKWATLYHTENLRFRGAAVYTNQVPCGAYRGVGTAQIHFAMESQIDEIARELGVDPIEYRMRHAIRPGDLLPGGTPVRALGLEECVARGKEAIGWNTPIPHSDGRFARGRGMALGLHHAGFTNLIPGLIERSICRARLIDGGRRIAVHIAAVDKGQGAIGTMMAVAAQTLHCELDGIVVDPVDTSAPYDALGAEASRSTYVQGRAVQGACTELQDAIVGAAARRLGIPVGGLTVEDGWVVAGDDRLLAFADVAEDLVDVVVEHEYTPTDLDPLPVVAADFCEVEVDRLTGVVRVLRFVAVQDAGKVINVLGAEGQIEGGVHHGLGYALTETLEIEDGQPMNGNFAGYRVLMAPDMPEIEPILVETVDEEAGPFGAKGLGTGVIPAVAAAAANAIRDALGVRPLRVPITPARVIELLDG